MTRRSRSMRERLLKGAAGLLHRLTKPRQGKTYKLVVRKLVERNTVGSNRTGF